MKTYSYYVLFLLVVFLRMFPSHGINIAGWQYKISIQPE